MKLLALDTSSARGGIIVGHFPPGGAPHTIHFRREYPSDRTHSASLFEAIEDARPFLDSLDGILVGLGPGSYAGVRVSLSAAQGLSLGLGVPLAGRPSLTAIETDAETYQIIGDARRHTYYHALVRHRKFLHEPELMEWPELERRLAAHVEFPALGYEAIAAFPQVKTAHPSAEILAQEFARAPEWPDKPATVEPIYLRAPHITLPKVM